MSYHVLLDLMAPDAVAHFRAIAHETPVVDWIQGRQGSGYFKRYLRLGAVSAETLRPIAFAQRALIDQVNGGNLTDHMDALLIRYPAGSSIPDHVDPAPEGFSHHRLNVLLTPTAGSGTLYVEGRPVGMSQGDAVIFSSGSLTHRVDNVEDARLVLSVGMLVPK